VTICNVNAPTAPSLEIYKITQFEVPTCGMHVSIQPLWTLPFPKSSLHLRHMAIFPKRGRLTIAPAASERSAQCRILMCQVEHVLR
jgi:hypothetical protein